MQVVRDAEEGDGQQHVVVAGVVIFAKDLEHFAGVRVAGNDRAVGPLPKEIEEAILCVRVVAREGQEGELSVEEEDGIAGFKKVFGGCLGVGRLDRSSLYEGAL